MTRNWMLRVEFERNYESGIPGCGMYLRDRVVADCPELVVGIFGQKAMQECVTFGNSKYSRSIKPYIWNFIRSQNV